MLSLRPAALLLMLLWLSTSLEAAWTTTSFEAYEGWPVETPDWAEREAGNASNDLNPAILRDVENYLFAVAKRLETMKFADPVVKGVLNSLVTREDGEKVIRVYLYSNPSASSLASYRLPPPCNPPGTRAIISINTAKFGFLNKIHDGDYNSLAHELFHAVQFASDFMKNSSCDRTKWIREGTADAVGFHFARVLRNAQNRPNVSVGMFMKEFGIRDYGHPLNRPNTSATGHGTDDYQTSSFWRHLAELYYTRVANNKPHPGSQPQKENYKYLAEFFNKPFSFSANPDGEITWLSQQMKTNTKIRGSLAEHYPQFISTFGDFINTRIGSYDFLGPGERSKKWFNRVFGACAEVSIPAPPAAKAAKSIAIRPNSARCMNVKKAGTASMGLTILVTHNDKDLLKQLRVATLDGTEDSRPIIRSKVGGGPPHIAKWVYPLFGPYVKTFVLTNVSEYPAATRSFDPTLEMSLVNWNSSMTNVPTPVGPQNSPPPPPKVGPQQAPLAPPATQRTTQRELKKQATLAAFEDPVNSLKPVTKVDRRGYDRLTGCRGPRLQHNLCGPQLVVNLELSPLAVEGNILDIAQGQILQSAMGFEPDDPQATMDMSRIYATAQQMDDFKEANDGTKIVLRLPKIEYGFTGTISNAEIIVSKAGGGNYLAYGPEIPYGIQIIHRPPNGQVQIEEYSPQVLIGNFLGELVDPANPGRDKAPVIARRIEGSFLAPAPYENDEEFEVDEANVHDAVIRNMLDQAPFEQEFFQQMMGADGPPPQIMCDQGVDDETLRSMGFTKGCGGRSGQMASQCSCDCEKRVTEELTPACSIRCEREWNACKVKDEPLSAEASAQIAEYRSYLDAQNLPPEVIDSLVTAFRDMPQWQRDLTLQGFR